jgi:hypothetical protein
MVSFRNGIRRSLLRSLSNKKETPMFKKYFKFSVEELRERLESMFDDKMAWDNFGYYWGIDFIIHPKHYRFKKLVGFEFDKCYSIRNIRPLVLKDLKKKQGRLLWDEINEYGIFDLLPIGKIHIVGKNIFEKEVNNLVEKFLKENSDEGTEGLDKG